MALTGVPALTSSASAATLKDGRWCNPARGHFPAGGYYGAPRGPYPHAGQDVTNSTGTAVYAAAAGTVVRRGTGVLSGRTGNGLVISHGGGRYTYYGHLSAFRVPLNAKVAAGQRVADMGTTGNATGPHLHFETHSGGLGSTVNPVSYLAARGVDLGGGWPAINPGAVGATVKAVQYLITQAMALRETEPVRQAHSRPSPPRFPAPPPEGGLSCRSTEILPPRPRPAIRSQEHPARSTL
ncbi:M23 family metallopeptidase [Streptomyces sp. NBC_00057]